MKTTQRNLRIREDTPKYLRNLDLNSAYYDPQARSMRAPLRRCMPPPCAPAWRRLALCARTPAAGSHRAAPAAWRPADRRLATAGMAASRLTLAPLRLTARSARAQPCFGVAL